MSSSSVRLESPKDPWHEKNKHSHGLKNRIGASREKIGAVNIYIYIYIYTRDFSSEDVREAEKFTLAKLDQIASNMLLFLGMPLRVCLKKPFKQKRHATSTDLHLKPWAFPEVSPPLLTILQIPSSPKSRVGQTLLLEGGWWVVVKNGSLPNSCCLEMFRGEMLGEVHFLSIFWYLLDIC